jgi:hypothetical protein
LGLHFFANPRLQAMEKCHFAQIFLLHWDKISNALNTWTYYTKVSSPYPWWKLNNFCPSFKIWLCEMNLSFNLVLKSFQNKVSIKSNSTSYCAMHHSKTWSNNKYKAILSQLTIVMIAWVSKYTSIWRAFIHWTSCPSLWRDSRFDFLWLW